MQRYEELKVWQRSHRLALAIYRLTNVFPPDERFGLTSQLRRAAVSVAANISEGARRRTAKDYAHFLNIAEASSAELHYLLRLCHELGLGGTHAAELMDQSAHVSRMLLALRARVEAAIRSETGKPRSKVA